MIPTFWSWLAYPKTQPKTGWKLLVNWWLALHLCIAVLLASGLRANGFAFASKALFPAASILVSMAVAWTARAATILNDEKFRKEIISNDRPLEDYVYGYQFSLLIIILTVVFIAVMAAGGFSFVILSREISIYMSSFFMYFLISLSIRECWTVINFSNLLALLASKSSK